MIQLSSDFDRDTPPPAWILIPSVTLSLVSTAPERMMKISDIWYSLLSISSPVAPRSALSALQLSACHFSATSSFQIWEAAVTYQFYVLSRHTWNTIWDKRENQCRHTAHVSAGPLGHSNKHSVDATDKARDDWNEWDKEAARAGSWAFILLITNLFRVLVRAVSPNYHLVMLKS